MRLGKCFDPIASPSWGTWPVYTACTTKTCHQRRLTFCLGLDKKGISREKIIWKRLEGLICVPSQLARKPLCCHKGEILRPRIKEPFCQSQKYVYTAS